MIELEFFEPQDKISITRGALSGNEQHVQRSCHTYQPYACMIGFQAVHVCAAAMLLLCTKAV